LPIVEKEAVAEKVSYFEREGKGLRARDSRQCLRCMECLRNMTNATANSLIPVVSNSTNPNNSTNSTKILFCKSKAAFFKKVYDALSANPSKSKNVGRVQAYGKALSEFLGKECFVDSQLD
jgi:hypothetical protein